VADITVKISRRWRKQSSAWRFQQIDCRYSWLVVGESRSRRASTSRGICACPKPTAPHLAGFLLERLQAHSSRGESNALGRAITSRFKPNGWSRIRAGADHHRRLPKKTDHEPQSLIIDNDLLQVEDGRLRECLGCDDRPFR